MEPNAFSSGQKVIVALPGGLGAVAAIVQQPRPSGIQKEDYCVPGPSGIKKEDYCVQFKKLGTISKVQMIRQMAVVPRASSESLSSYLNESSNSIYYKAGSDEILFADEAPEGPKVADAGGSNDARGDNKQKKAGRGDLQQEKKMEARKKQEGEVDQMRLIPLVQEEEEAAVGTLTCCEKFLMCCFTVLCCGSIL